MKLVLILLLHSGVKGCHIIQLPQVFMEIFMKLEQLLNTLQVYLLF